MTEDRGDPKFWVGFCLHSWTGKRTDKNIRNQKTCHEAQLQILSMPGAYGGLVGSHMTCWEEQTKGFDQHRPTDPL